MAFTEKEIFDIMAQILDDRVQYLATKEDLKEVSEPLKAHLKQHEAKKQMWSKVRFAALGSFLAGIVSFVVAWVKS